MNHLLKGALAGLAATAPMTLAMGIMHRRLPRSEQYPLPPRLITDEVIEETGVSEKLDEQDRGNLARVAHFSYGAAVGSVYPLLSRRSQLPPVVGGVLYGLTVWGVSYLGLLPAIGVLRPATEHPRRRTALMIAAHVVWGASVGILVGKASKRSEGDQ
jgi:uncharacterized membrane protein YagU involved in acid resistance